MYEFMKECVISFGFGIVVACDGYLLFSGAKALITWIKNKLRKEKVQ